MRTNLAVIAVACLVSLVSVRIILRHSHPPVRATQSADRLVGSGLAAVVVRVSPEKNPDREAYFGETHVHTSWSFDAYIFGNHLTGPAEAYEYATGQSIKHPNGYEIKITTPLDWMGVTDHSEYVGTIRLANKPGSAINKLPIREADSPQPG